MNKASQIIVLCEDKAHSFFVRRFLTKGWGVPNRIIRVLPYPSGKGSGKKYVEDNLAEEVQGCRTRSASTILLVVRDADEQSVEEVKSILDVKLKPSRTNTEPIAYIIPKWHIQTWIAYLDGLQVDESDKSTYKRTYRSISENKQAHALIDRLAGNCKGKEELKSSPESLVSACEEFNRIRSALCK